jgi:epimerase EvaD
MMSARELAVVGAFEFTCERLQDERGFFASPFEEATFSKAVGRPFFQVSQVSLSQSRRGVLRGVHFSATPPGRPKYAYCPRGRAYDIVVDLRVGSPTFGKHEVVLLDQGSLRAVYFPAGVGHAFVALENDTLMSYLISGSYVPADEHAVDPFDPALGLTLPTDVRLVLSQRDQDAPSLAEAAATRLLPHYADCVAADALVP